VLEYIIGHQGSQAHDINEALSVPRDTLNKIIKVLSDNHLIERRGSKKTGGYYAIQ
jgi:ATP-dependent DNA helicase RecG